MKTGKVECSECKEKFRDKYDLTRHLKTHEKKPGHLRNHKVCPICALQLKYIDEHLMQTHGVGLESENLVFSCAQDFELWKEKIEQETNSRYVKNFGTKKRKDGTNITRYFCHRKGKYRPRGRNIRKLKINGSNKINAHCPSSIRVIENKDECLSVLFQRTHVGHTCDVQRMVLTKSEKEKIAEKVSSKIPLDDILNEVRNSPTGEDLRRVHISTKQDIRNIIATYGLELNEHEANDVCLPNLSTKTEEIDGDDLETIKKYEIEILNRIFNGIKTKDGLMAYRKIIAPLKTAIENANNSTQELQISQNESRTQRKCLKYQAVKKGPKLSNYKKLSSKELNHLPNLVNGLIQNITIPDNMVLILEHNY